MSESKWIASREAGELMHAAAYRIVADDEDETWVCWADTAEFAAQIAHKHNTHAALVEAVENAREAVVRAADCYGRNSRFDMALQDLDKALAAAKGATSER